MDENRRGVMPLSRVSCDANWVDLDIELDSRGRLSVKATVYLISGRVQGVGFRWFAEREASRHRVVGYVRNLADGRVEVLAQGDAAELERLEDALRRGPSSSRVVSVESRTAAVDPSLTSFEVRY